MKREGDLEEFTRGGGRENRFSVTGWAPERARDAFPNFRASHVRPRPPLTSSLPCHRINTLPSGTRPAWLTSNLLAFQVHSAPPLCVFFLNSRALTRFTDTLLAAPLTQFSYSPLSFIALDSFTNAPYCFHTLLAIWTTSKL